LLVFEEVFASTLGREGGYVDNPNDPGGATRWGSTETVARVQGYRGAMSRLTRKRAAAIAKQAYWDVLLLDDVASLSRPLAEEMFDTGYNMGPRIPVRFLQRALNLLNRSHREVPDYPALVVDGLMGPASLAALGSFLGQRGQDGERLLLRALNAQKAERYLSICEERETSEDFLFGWLLNRVS